MSKCPICKVPLVRDSFYDSDIHQTVEEYEECKNGCKQYSYAYSYGSWMMELGTRMFTGGHGDSKTRQKKRHFIYMRKLAKLRKAYRKTKGN